MKVIYWANILYILFEFPFSEAASFSSSNAWNCFEKKLLQNVLQSLQESTCVGKCSLMVLQGYSNFFSRETPVRIFSCKFCVISELLYCRAPVSDYFCFIKHPWDWVTSPLKVFVNLLLQFFQNTLRNIYENQFLYRHFSRRPPNNSNLQPDISGITLVESYIKLNEVSTIVEWRFI